MKDPRWHFAGMRELIAQYEESEELRQARARLEELEMWIGKCKPSKETIERDLLMPV